jgi:transglutaminase-like putative cysteine protease
MKWLRITHQTTYRYASAVAFGPHRLVLRPREGHDVRVEDMALEISPAYDLQWTRDIFGNSIATVFPLGTAEELRIRSSVVLRQTTAFPRRSAPSSSALPFPLHFSTLELPVITGYQQTSFPSDQAVVGRWVGETFPDLLQRDALEVLYLINTTFKAKFGYRRRDEKGVQTPAETLAGMSGSCRDLATLMLETLRIVGFPARFASGYLDCSESLAGRASTHAWAEAYLPDFGWMGFDPTIGEPTSEKHVVTGMSAHPRGVMPVTGTYFGKAGLYLGMEVAVKTERLAEWDPCQTEVS